MEESIYFINYYIKQNCIIQNDKKNDKKNTIFNSLKIPEISIKDYLTRIYKYTDSTYEISIITYILLNNHRAKTPDPLIINNTTIAFMVTSERGTPCTPNKKS